MSDLQLNDQVLVQTDFQIKFQPVTSWLHRSINGIVNYTVLQTDSGNISLSAGHNIAVYDEKIIYKMANNVSIGDIVIQANGQRAKVINISHRVSKGIYAPYTPTGNLFVGDDNVQYLSHCFSNIQEPEYYFGWFDAIIRKYEYVYEEIIDDDVEYIHPVAKTLLSLFGENVLETFSQDIEFVPTEIKNTALKSILLHALKSILLQRQKRIATTTTNSDDDDNDDSREIFIIFMNALPTCIF